MHEDNWQATVGLFTGAMAKEVVVGTLNTLYTAENIQEQDFNPAEFHLGHELLNAVEETWQSLKDTLAERAGEPIEASKGDGEMATVAMGVMGENFGSASAATATSSLFCSTFRASRDGGDCPRVQPRLDGLSPILWG